MSDPFSPSVTQGVNVRVCSLVGGPLTVDVHSPDADFNTGLGVHVTPTSLGIVGVADADRLIAFVQDQGIGVDTHLESRRPLDPGECVDVMIGSTQYFRDPGLPFTYTINW